jgi:hypothetical protein
VPTIIERDGKKHQIYNPNSPEDMALAHKIAQEQLQKLGWNKPQGQTEQEAENQLNKAEEGAKLFDEMRSKVEGWYSEKGLQSPNITDKDSLTSAIKNLDQIEKLEANQQPFREPTGSAPLSWEQEHGRAKLEGEYGSNAEMIDDLRSKAHSGDKTAKLILDRLFEKALKGSKTEKKGIAEYQPAPNDESEIQRLNRNFRERKLKGQVVEQ